ncbi:MAG TPA: signal peptidase I [Firmicutes bacterium]|nr:signal peptidase I [Bacillota bacterium]
MKRVLLEILDWIKTFVIIFLIVTLVHKYVFTPVKVDGPSMYPTLHHEDSVILWEFNYEPEPFDVVVFEFSEDVYYVKRVIGMPGQTITYQDDKLYIDGEYVEETFLDEGKASISYMDSFTWDFTLEEICQFENCDVIPEGYYLVLGDNRPHSKDSRHIGLVSESQILGKATWIQWPLENFGRVE